MRVSCTALATWEDDEEGASWVQHGVVECRGETGGGR